MVIYAQSGDSKNSIEMFDWMMGDFRVHPYSVGLVNDIPYCGSIGEQKWEIQILCFEPIVVTIVYSMA